MICIQLAQYIGGALDAATVLVSLLGHLAGGLLASVMLVAIGEDLLSTPELADGIGQ